MCSAPPTAVVRFCSRVGIARVSGIQRAVGAADDVHEVHASLSRLRAQRAPGVRLEHFLDRRSRKSQVLRPWFMVRSWFMVPCSAYLCTGSRITVDPGAKDGPRTTDNEPRTGDYRHQTRSSDLLEQTERGVPRDAGRVPAVAHGSATIVWPGRPEESRRPPERAAPGPRPGAGTDRREC